MSSSNLTSPTDTPVNNNNNNNNNDANDGFLSKLDFSRMMGGDILQSDLLGFGSHPLLPLIKSTTSSPSTSSTSNNSITPGPTDEYDGSVNILNMKAQWIRNQLKSREKEFTEKKNITVFTGTWNVNGKRPTESLSPWFKFDGPPPDIYAIAFQELDLTAEALLLGDTSRAAPWEQLIQTTLRSLGPYTKVHTRQLVGMLILVFVLDRHLPFISEVKSGAAGVGIMGMMGNKGGVAIRFQFYDSTICFVNSHLSAHFDATQRRNQDYKEVCRRVVFQDDSTDSVYTIFDHDHLFWIGDLNYRINLPDYEVRRRVKAEDWSGLFQQDQLYNQMKLNAVFEQFSEAPINFAPTYKYDPGTTIYDTSEKNRTPAWCDRVLWYGQNIVPLVYTRHELLSSDHRPVSCVFAVQAKSIIPEAKSEVYKSILSQVDKMENETLPDAVIDQQEVIFEDVHYMVPQTKTITIENTGQVVARFRFIPKLDERKFCKPWLWVNPPFGMMIPKEKVTVELTVHVDNATAPDLNNAPSTALEDILILHLEGGKDHFIAVSGNYLRSCFGCYLDQLVRHTLPIREGAPVMEDHKVLSIPKELWRLVDYIYHHGMDKVDLFLQSGEQSEIDLIIECLDTGKSLDDYQGSIESVAETVVRFLESLAEPLIPYSLYKQAIDSSGSYAQCKQVLSSLPTVNYNVFYYLMSFLRELLVRSASNHLTPEKLAVVFSSVLIRPPPVVQSEPVVNRKAKVEFIYHFLSPTEDLTVP